MNKIYFLLMIMFFSSVISAQEFVQLSENNLELNEQFSSILSKANEDIFIGYSIKTNTDNFISIGSFYFDDDSHGFSLRDVINNNAKYNDYFAKNSKQKKILIHEHRIRITMTSSKNRIQPDSETAIIFHYSKGESNAFNFNEVLVCNLALNIKFAPAKFYWLGNIETNKSVNYLIDIFKSSINNKFKEDIIPAIGMHNSEVQVTPFLIDIATDKSNPKLREDSFYWLGYQNNMSAFNTLKNIIHSNDSNNIREEAIMGLAQMSLAEAFNEIINIAKRSTETALRKEAIMWLGEKAVKKASEELKGFIENDPEIEIKKYALYALSEQSNDHLDYFMKLAKSNISLTIRKNAIYILGESEDKRAVDFLVELASGN